MMKKVLIINEDDEEAKQLQELFINEITNVVCAINIDDALAHFLTEDFALIILEANLTIEDDSRIDFIRAKIDFIKVKWYNIIIKFLKW